jgi:hypothetical protein
VRSVVLNAVVLRAVAVLCAAGWLIFPGFGLIDLAVSWSSDWPVVLEAGWGLFFTVLAGAAFVDVALRPHRALPVLVQVAVAAVVLGGSAVASAEWPLLPLAALLLAETVLTTALARKLPGNDIRRPWTLPASPLLLALAAVGAVPWASYAVAMWRADRADQPADVSVGVDHYAVQGALAAALVVLSALAAGWPRGRRFLGLGTGVAAAYLGLVSLAWPGSAGGLGPVWSAPALGWGVTVAALAAWPDRLQGRQLVGEVVESERAL